MVRFLKAMKAHIFLIIILFNGSFLSAQIAASAWVDSVYLSMSREQRIAQLLVLRAYSNKDSTYNDSLNCLTEIYQPGGLCFFQGGPVRQVQLVNRLQQTSKIPMLICIDAEWGLGMRLDSGFSFPRQMALGAMKNDSLIYRMGQIIGRDCNRAGIHVNFAPVADVNNNPMNPVISFRSFGENREEVARRSILYMKGMQEKGLITTGKHFPGHGDTDNDSHYTLPVINHSRERLDSIELYPFRELIQNGLNGMMVAHLYVPALDSTPNTATTLSPRVITGLLRQELGFKELIFTDALDMQGVTNYFKPGEIEVRALLAGNDLLLLPQHIDQAIMGIGKAIDSGLISSELLEEKCKKVLAMKEKLHLKSAPLIETKNLVEDINQADAFALTDEMVRNSLTLLGNDLLLIPITNPEKRKIAVLSIGDTTPTLITSTLAKYAPVSTFRVPKNFSDSVLTNIFNELGPYDLVIAVLHGISSSPGRNYGITPSMQKLTDTISGAFRTIVAVLGTPYALNSLKNPGKAEALIVAYQDNDNTQKATAEAIFGGSSLTGRLPVSTNGYPLNAGAETNTTRLGSTLAASMFPTASPEKVIDSLVTDGIAKKAFPGCQVLLAKDGKIFFDKAYGNPAFDDSVALTTEHIYDLASVTKVAATTLAVMKLYDQGKIHLDDTVGKFLKVSHHTNKSSLKIGQILAHEAGLQDWIPFYRETLNDGVPDTSIYNISYSDLFTVKVAENLYISKAYQDSIIHRIMESPLRNDKSYKYSDLGFILLKMIVERISGISFSQYLDENFYRPLGLTTLTFNPLEKFPSARICPTENDQEFRNQWIRGYVHDPAAAMMGGISGHAGLFGTSRDLAVILQMLLNDGEYGGKRFISPETVHLFTKTYDPPKNRRGLGFDKPPLKNEPGGPVCTSASLLSFGHSGFTGTYIWADPANDLLYVFLSNRVCPDANNQKLSMMNIRTNIHQVVYDHLRKISVK